MYVYYILVRFLIHTYIGSERFSKYSHILILYTYIESTLKALIVFFICGLFVLECMCVKTCRCFLFYLSLYKCFAFVIFSMSSLCVLNLIYAYLYGCPVAALVPNIRFSPFTTKQYYLDLYTSDFIYTYIHVQSICYICGKYIA